MTRLQRTPTAWSIAAMLACVTPSCGAEEPAPAVVRAAPGSGIDLARATWLPEDAVDAAWLVTSGRLELPLRRPGPVVVSAPGACPAPVDGGASRDVSLRPWLDVVEPPPFVGHDAPFDIRVRFPCATGPQSPSWRQTAGPRVGFEVKEGGAVLTARTPSIDSVGAAALDWGIVPVSHQASAPLVFEVSARHGATEIRRLVRVAATPRSTGLPTLSIGQQALLGGDGWTILSAPPESGAVLGLAQRGGAPPLTTLSPDVPGRWLLADRDGHELALSAGRHDAMPLDCGRSECHASAAASSVHSPMTTAFKRGITGELGPSFDARCAVECHAVGEPALDDGFVAVARALGVELPTAPAGPDAWDALPAPLRRLGGVGCTACHGPSALPERSARWRIVRADVCAICHDAPPRYGHVAAWRSSRMASSDADPRTLSGGCARCHTTLGFLDWTGARSLRGEPVPERAGIACAACHAPHAASMPTALVRRVDPPASLGAVHSLPGFGDDAPSRVCLRCHAPIDGEPTPSATAAVLVLGEPDSRAAAPHAIIEGGCLGCHSAGPTDVTLERGASHGFRADPARCARCHEGGAPKERPDTAGRLVSDRARSLWKRIVDTRLARTSDPDAPHASIEILATPGSERARAVADVLTVLEDPAAGIHGAGRARQLLDLAEQRLRDR